MKPFHPFTLNYLTPFAMLEQTLCEVPPRRANEKHKGHLIIAQGVQTRSEMSKTHKSENEKPTIRPLPRNGLDPPPPRTPISLTGKIGNRPDQSHFLRPPKLQQGPKSLKIGLFKPRNWSRLKPQLLGHDMTFQRIRFAHPLVPLHKKDR